MIVSLCIVAYNEEAVIENILQDIIAQTYPHNKMEICLINSMSTDSTRAKMVDFQKERKDFKNIVVLDNPKKRQAPGWNVALANYQGDVIIRIDAHAAIPEDFVEKNIEILATGENISGGPRPNISEESTAWKETLLRAEQSMFGSSIAPYRRESSEEKIYVKSLFHGAYRREVFDKVGKFNECLGRTEDNEMNYRIRKAGYKLCYSSKVISYQHARNSLKGMLKQKFGNGYWVSLTLKVCPQCLSIYHFIPLAFVLSIKLTTIMAIVGYPLFAIALWSIYWSVAVVMAVMANNKKRDLYNIFLPLLFLLSHVSYGIGSLIGIIKIPFWKCEDTNEL